MESRAKGRGKVKQETRQGNRQILGDISNLEVSRIAEGKKISRPITRNYHAKLLANAQAAANLVLALEVPANDQGAEQGKKNVIVPALGDKAGVHKKYGEEEWTHEPDPEPVDVASSEAGEKVDFVCERKGRERSGRKVQTLTSILTTVTKAAYGNLTEPKDQPVDIDAEDANDEFAVVEYLDELYEFYKQTEGESRVSDYMKSQHEINEKMRSITMDWLVDVHRKFKLMPETLYLTINIIDRYLSLTSVPKKELQLVGISSMLIACKYEEIWPPQIKDFISISDNAYTKNQIISMEKDILEKLQWYFTVPTPYVFLVRLVRVSVMPDKEMENLAFYLTELGLVHYEAVILYSPSKIAAAAVYSARCTLNKRPLWNEMLQQQSGYCTEQIIYCAKLLVRFQASAADSKMIQAVYWKFSSQDRGSVALLPAPKNIV